MTNPQAFNAIMQIQQRMAQLRAVASEAVGSLGKFTVTLAKLSYVEGLQPVTVARTTIPHAAKAMAWMGFLYSEANKVMFSNYVFNCITNQGMIYSADCNVR